MLADQNFHTDLDILIRNLLFFKHSPDPLQRRVKSPVSECLECQWALVDLPAQRGRTIRLCHYAEALAGVRLFGLRTYRKAAGSAGLDACRRFVLPVLLLPDGAVRLEVAYCYSKSSKPRGYVTCRAIENEEKAVR